MAAASVAESPTLRCLLADDLGIQLRRVGPGIRMTFVEGEQPLSSLSVMAVQLAVCRLIDHFAFEGWQRTGGRLRSRSTLLRPAAAIGRARRVASECRAQGREPHPMVW